MNILVVKMTSMGDVVHTLPAVSDIAQALPHAHIDWLVEAPFAGIVELHPHVRHAITVRLRSWRKQWWRADVQLAVRQATARLRQERYDLIIDFQGLLKSAWWARKAIGPVAGYDKTSAREPLAARFYQRHAQVAKQQNAVTRNRQLAAQHLGYAPHGGPDFGLAVPKSTWPVPQPYAVLMPAASRAEKLWPLADWLAVAAQLKARHLAIVVLWGSAAEKERADVLAAQCGGLVPPFLSVHEAAGVLAQAAVVVGLDTGFTHLAAALNVPTIGIYCDHDPGLAAVTGNAFTASLGGKGTPPPRDAVLAVLQQALGA
jgi:heptosyltransferase I